MVARLARVSVREGETVIEEGAAGTCMYLIAEGSFRVERHGADQAPRILAEMGAGEFFGEMSLLSGAPRLASVVAARDGVLLRLERSDLDALSATNPQVGEVVERFYKERLIANVVRASGSFASSPRDSVARWPRSCTSRPTTWERCCSSKGTGEGVLSPPARHV